MNFWNNIINTALIGTDKKSIGENEMPEILGEQIGLINKNTKLDKEDKFLQTASLALNFKQAGIKATPLPTPSINLAPPEDKTYCNYLALQTLKDVLIEENIPLLKYWLQQCADKKQIIHPELIPSILKIGVEEKKLQAYIAVCCGQRGLWLSQFNPAWNFSQNQTEEELWEIGSFEQRKSVLATQRNTNPAIALQWVSATWSQEDANTKLSFLEILANKIGENDLSFLISLSNEKSKKVKDLADHLLKQIACAPIVLHYQSILKETISIKQEKKLFGLSSKMVIEFSLPKYIEENIYKSGIDKLSKDKTFTDDEFIISQLISSVPPHFWEDQLQISPKEIIQQLENNDTAKKMIPALVKSICRFKDKSWAEYFIQHSSIFYIDLIPLLSQDIQDLYCIKYFEQFPEEIFQHAIKSEYEWSPQLCYQIFAHAAKNHYYYNKTFFSKLIFQIPTNIDPTKVNVQLKEEHVRNGWENNCEYINKLIHIKLAISNAFND
jgi:hypothetical protein